MKKGRFAEYLATKKVRKEEELKRLQWMEKVKKRGIPERDMRLLDRASKILANNIMLGNGGTWGNSRGIVPSLSHFRGVWNWDSAFHALCVARFDPDLAYEQCEIFLNNQRPDGLFPDVLHSEGEIKDNYSKPPVFPWAFAQVYRRSPDKNRLQKAYEGYCLNENFWHTKRYDEKYGLFYYDAEKIDEHWLTHQKWESGMDNSPRWDNGVSNLLAVDQNAFMVLFYDAMAYLAKEMGKEEDAKHWQVRKEETKQRINEHLWCEERGMYLDKDRFTGEFSYVMSSAHFVPLFAECADKKQAEKIAANAADEKKFFPSMPTTAFDEPTFNATKYWRGPVWLNYVYWAVEGLRKYGYNDLADSIRETILHFVDKNRRTIYENYNPKTGKGLGAHGFGWSSVFTIEMICATLEGSEK